MSEMGDLFHQVLRVNDNKDDLDFSKQTRLDQGAGRRCREFIEEIMDRETKSSEKRREESQPRDAQCLSFWNTLQG